MRGRSADRIAETEEQKEVEDGRKEERAERIRDMFYHPEPDKVTNPRPSRAISPTAVTLNSQDFSEMNEG